MPGPALVLIALLVSPPPGPPAAGESARPVGPPGPLAPAGPAGPPQQPGAVEPVVAIGAERAAGGALHGACVMPLEAWEGAYRPELGRSLFAGLRELGANAVALSAHAWQDELGSTVLRPHDGSPRAAADLKAAIGDAHAAGLAVLLKPHVEIGRGGQRDASVWRGEIRFEDPARAAAWFASYRSFLRELAVLAAETRVEVLAVGLELAGLSRAWPSEWSLLVAELRALYPGRLTYCANWWGEFGETELWAQLDLLAVQAFAPLSTDPRAGTRELRRGAERLVESWRAESLRWGKPLLLSELGYKSSPAPWVEPWQWQPGPARPLAQLAAYRALLQALAEAEPEQWLAGSFAWLYEAGQPAPGPADGGFSPGGKPAERLLSRFWREQVGAGRGLGSPPPPPPPR